MRRSVILILAFACGILVASAVAATAADTITPGPTSQPGDPFGGQTLSPGPVYVITPGAGGTALPPPSDPKDVQAQIDKDKQRASGTPTAPTATPTAGSTADAQVPGAESSSAPNPGKSDAADTSSSVWWAVGVGVLAVVALLVVLVAARRRRDRERADSLKEHAS